MYHCTTIPSPAGNLTLACCNDKLVGLWMENQKYFGDTVPEKMIQKDDCPVFASAKAWLTRYFNGEKPSPSELPLAPIGGGFRQSVWKILCEIPYGQTLSYGGIAKKIAAQSGKNMSAQAVGNAVGHNPISIIIPCHRVVGTNGSLTGFSGGIAKKTALLKFEGVDISNLIVPTKGTAL